jgi:hypothetical protein
MRAAVLGAAVFALTGCNSEQLRYTTLRLSQTVPDLQEQQVIDNLARQASSPNRLPYYAVVNIGTANIVDTGGAGLNALTFQHHVGSLATVNTTASRAVTGNWTLNPMSNPDRLRAMRAAYQVALGSEFIDPVDMAKLTAILKEQKGLDVHPGWLAVGEKSEVPQRTCVVGHCGSTYVWVTPEHSKEFADFALLMLNIATWSPPPPAGTPKLDLSIDKIPPITFGLPKAPGAQAPAAYPVQPESPVQRRLYEDSQSINRGLFFVPR